MIDNKWHESLINEYQTELIKEIKVEEIIQEGRKQKLSDYLMSFYWLV